MWKKVFTGSIERGGSRDANRVLESEMDPLQAERHDDDASFKEQQGTEIQQWNESLWQAIRNRREVSSSSTLTDKNHTGQVSALLLGQMIALLSSGMNASSYTLNQHFGLETQFFQMFWMYLLLSLHMFVRQERGESPYTLPGTRIRLRVPWWIYLGISVLDVFPNFMTLISFRYTSLTSTTLLGSLTVPSTMLFSRYILAKVFLPRHYLGVCLCLAGGLMTVWSDVDHDTADATASSNPTTTLAAPSVAYIGDLLAVAAALLYGFGDTVAEYSIKHIDREEYLGMIGVFGALFTLFYSSFLEGDAIRHLFQMSFGVQLQVLATLVWYVTSVCLYYVTEASFLRQSDATLLNLSMQTSNLYAIAFSVVVYRDLPPGIFYLALTLVVAGVFVYERGIRVGLFTKHETDSIEVEPLCKDTDVANYETVE